MSNTKIKVDKCIQDVQIMSGNDDASVMMSKVFFSIEYNNEIYNDVYVEITQNYGGNYAEDPLEVHSIVGFDNKLNYNQFSDKIEEYYRSLIDSNASGSDIRMTNNTFFKDYEFEVEVVNLETSGW